MKMTSLGCDESSDFGWSLYGGSAATTATFVKRDIKEQDIELLQVCSEFHEVNAELDRLVSDDLDPPEPRLRALHKRWQEACRSAVSLVASTVEGRRAKAAMLVCVLDVILGQTEDRELHELLAESLARDLLR